VARNKKKRARELKHDRFRDTTIILFDKLGDRLEGKGRTILYGVVALIAIASLIGIWSWWSGRKRDEARLALGRAIEVASANISAAPAPGATGQTFPDERTRAERAVAEFDAVAAKYGDPYRENARYFAATNRLVVDRERGVSELEALSRSSDRVVAAWSKFALAQAREAEGQLDAAAALYTELAGQSDPVIPADTVNLSLASVYEKQNKRQEAVELLFNIVNAARSARDQAGLPVAVSGAAREATQRLQRLDPARYAQLPAEPVSSGLPF
jgi:tetratricopeptide (TPR) repeat protein